MTKAKVAEIQEIQLTEGGFPVTPELQKLADQIEKYRSEVRELELAIEALMDAKYRAGDLENEEILHFLSRELDKASTEAERLKRWEITQYALQQAKGRLEEREEAYRQAVLDYDCQQIAEIMNAKIELVLASQKAFVTHLNEFEQMATRYNPRWGLSNKHSLYGVSEHYQRKSGMFPTFVASNPPHGCLVPFDSSH